MTKHPVEDYFPRSVWGTLFVYDDGTAKLGQFGLTAEEAAEFADPLACPGGQEIYSLAPVAKENCHDKGTWGVVYMIGNLPYIAFIGLTENTARKAAKRVVAEHGPDAAEKPSPDGFMDLTPVVRAAWALEMTHVMEELRLLDTFTCVICEGKFPHEEANNPDPVMNWGSCCGMCNAQAVLPARLESGNQRRVAESN